MFPDVGSNAAVISLQNGPVVEGDVKVMFESSAVSACFYTFFFFLNHVRKAGVSPEPMILFLFIFLFRVCQKDTKMFHSTSGSIRPS